MPLVYKEALDIAVGDVVTTSYGSGPYRVTHIWGPKTWYSDHHEMVIWPYPIISLVLTYDDDHRQNPAAFINNVHREQDRWFTDCVTHLGERDEVFVQKPDTPTPPMQISLFTQVEPPPYQFQPGVDYNAGDGHVWHCNQCGTDFNADRRNRWDTPTHCETWAVPIIVMGNGQPGTELVRCQNV